MISNPGMYKKDDIYGLKVFQPKFRHWFEVNWSSHPLNEKKKFVEQGKQEISDNRGGLWRVLWVQAQSKLPQDPAMPLLGIYPKDAQSYCKNICSAMLLALFVIVRTLKHPRCPSTEEWIKKMWYIYTLEYHSAVKNNDTLNFACK